MSFKPIIVKIKENTDIAGKEISIGSSLSELYTLTTTIFHLKTKIRSVYDEDGNCIYNIKDIKKGSTIFASCEPHPKPLHINENLAQAHFTSQLMELNKKSDIKYCQPSTSPNLISIGTSSPLLQKQSPSIKKIDR